MRRAFVFTPMAASGALDIWNYLSEAAGDRVADRVVGRIYDECQKLGGTPGMGHYREDLLDKRHRFWSVGSYVIAYRWQVKPIQIVGVVHGARNLAAYFQR